MEDDKTKQNSANLSEFLGGLQKAKDEIPKSKAILKDKPKQAENYLICKDGIVAETDQTGNKNGWETIKETKG